MTDTGLSVSAKARLYDHMREVAACAGFDCLTEAITVAVRAKAALRTIATFDDARAGAHLAATGSYGRFDEPRSVQVAREALGMVHPVASGAEERPAAPGGNTLVSQRWSGEVAINWGPSLQAVIDAIECARPYVADAVRQAGGIETCEIGLRVDLERIDGALGVIKTIKGLVA